MLQVLPTSPLAQREVFQSCYISTGRRKAVAWKGASQRVALCQLRNDPSSMYQYPPSQCRHRSLIHARNSTGTRGFNNAQSLLSVPKPKSFQCKLGPVAKQSCSTFRLISGNSSNDNNHDDGAMVLDGETQNGCFVHYTVLIDGQQSRITKIKVNEGNDIDSIIEEIKAKNDILLAYVDVLQMEALVVVDISHLPKQNGRCDQGLF